MKSAKSTALMRCCKDLGIASELWDPTFIQEWKKQHAMRVWCENERTKKKQPLWRRKDRSAIQYPWIEQSAVRDEAEAQQYTQQAQQSQQSQTSTYSKPPSPPPPPPSFQPPPPQGNAGQQANTGASHTQSAPVNNAASSGTSTFDVKTPPPPPPPAQGTTGKLNLPKFSLPAGHTVPQPGQAPPAAPEQPVQPAKVFQQQIEDIDLNQQVPTELVEGTQHAGKYPQLLNHPTH